jgi:hypothetical protein
MTDQFTPGSVVFLISLPMEKNVSAAARIARTASDEATQGTAVLYAPWVASLRSQ